MAGTKLPAACAIISQHLPEIARLFTDLGREYGMPIAEGRALPRNAAFVPEDLGLVTLAERLVGEVTMDFHSSIGEGI